MSILIGYPGIGKSSLAGQNNFIDFESESFWNGGRRWSSWYVYYGNIANLLSQQGYKVLISSHSCVSDWLMENSNEKIYAIYPDKTLYKPWVQKLEERWRDSQSNKDFKAYMNAKECFRDDISSMSKLKCEHMIIKGMNYSLNEMLKNIET